MGKFNFPGEKIHSEDLCYHFMEWVPDLIKRKKRDEDQPRQ